jgi:hypothetical protein
VDQFARQLSEWLQKRVEEAERRDPELKRLKQRVRDATESVAKANDKDQPHAIRQQDEAILALIRHISK